MARFNGETFAQHLKKLLDHHDRKPADLAKALGVSKSYITEVLKERSRPFTTERCETTADFLNLTKEERKYLGDLALIERSNSEIRGIVEKGLGKKSPIIQLTEDPSDYEKIPMLGRCPASAKAWTADEVDGWHYFPKAMVRGRRMYLLKAAGDSMNKAGIEDGDFVVVHADGEPSNGKIVVICVDHEFTIKRFFRQMDQVTLMPESTNPNHSPMIFDMKKCQILLRGVVEAVHWKKIK